MFCCLPHVRADRAALLTLCHEIDANDLWSNTSSDGSYTPYHRTFRMDDEHLARCDMATTIADVGVQPDFVHLFKAPARTQTAIHTDLRATVVNIAFQLELGKSFMVYVDDNDQPTTMLSTNVPVLCRVDKRHYVDNLQTDIPRLIVSLGWWATYDKILPRILGRQEGSAPSASGVTILRSV